MLPMIDTAKPISLINLVGDSPLEELNRDQLLSAIYDSIGDRAPHMSAARFGTAHEIRRIRLLLDLAEKLIKRGDDYLFSEYATLPELVKVDYFTRGEGRKVYKLWSVTGLCDFIYLVVTRKKKGARRGDGCIEIAFYEGGTPSLNWRESFLV